MTTAKAVDEDEPSAAAVVGAAKGRLVSAMMKKHLCEAVVPVIIDLKRLLEARRHPLLGDLMAAIRALLKDYKSEARLLNTQQPTFVPAYIPLCLKASAPSVALVPQVNMWRHRADRVASVIQI